MNETVRLIASWLIAALSIGWGLRITVFQQQYIRSLVRKREKFKPIRLWLMGPNVYHTSFSIHMLLDGKRGYFSRNFRDFNFVASQAVNGVRHSISAKIRVATFRRKAS
jgi:hypothetical protein